MKQPSSDCPTLMHVAINTADLLDSIQFYRELFAREPDKVRPEYARFSLEEPGLVFTLNASAEPPVGRRLSHLGLRVRDQQSLDDARERLLASGFELREEEQTTCCYAVQNKFWVTDPDGNQWEFYRVLADAESYASIGASTGSGDASTPSVAATCCTGGDSNRSEDE